MGKRSLALGAVVLAVAFLCAAPPASASGVTPMPASGQDFDRIATKAGKEGHVRVLLGLRTTFTPEGKMSSAKRSDQRADIKKSQQDVRDDLKGTDWKELHAYDTVPMLSAWLSKKSVERLKTEESVASIQIDGVKHTMLASSAPIVEAPTMHAGGITGAGTTVAILDTGVDKTHPFLGGRVVEEACYSGGGFSNSSVCPGGGTSSTAVGSGVPCPVDCEHGTHVAGIAAGDGASFDGIARGANIMSVQVFSDDGGAYDSDIVKGLERVYAVQATHNVASVNLSLGGGRFSSSCNGEPQKPIIDQLASVGVATAIATGNDGWTNSISAPACISSAVAVASSTDSDTRSSFSNNHSTMTDVFAPGSSITSSVPGNDFDTYNGTSMATPHVAGAFALLKQAHPSDTVAEMLSALQSTGASITDGGYTRPRIRIAQAHTLLGGGTPDPDPDPDPDPEPDGDYSVTVTISSGTGRGYVESEDGGIVCSRPLWAGDDCYQEYAAGTEVTLWAVPYRGYRFAGWSGDFAPCGRFRGCQISAIDADYVATARFRRT